MADIFLSYARADRAQVTPLVAALEANGWSVWWDPSIAGGQEFDDLIARELEAARAAVVVWTPASVSSRWVRGEARIAADRGVLVPVQLNAPSLPIDARAFHTIELDAWKEDRQSPAFQDLVRALERLLAPAAQVSAAARRESVSIAVLPFVNMSPDPEQDYFSDGLTEELINQLAQLKALHVAGRTSSFSFKGRQEDLREIGHKLGVGHVLEGSVRRSGQRLRITAQLIKCSDGFHIWSERFDRELSDVFEVQDEIAGAVAKALSVTLGIGESPTRLPGGTDNIEAFDLMLRARTLIRRRQPGDAEGGVELLRRALALDPGFAIAWNVLANALTSLLTWSPPDPDAVRRQIGEALERAMALEPELWTAHEARANHLELQHDWVGAEQANARSRALAPKSMREPIISRAHQLAIVGRVNDAIPFAIETNRIEPLVSSSLQSILNLAGRFAEADAEFERSRELADPFLAALPALGRAMAQGRHELARERLAFCASFGHDPLYPQMLKVFDDAEAARDLLRREIGLFIESGRARHGIGIITRSPFVTYFGEPELALQLWRAAVPNLLGVAVMNIWHPLSAEMRQLPGFKDMVRELRIEEYWRATGEWGDFARPLGGDDFEIIK